MGGGPGAGETCQTTLQQAKSWNRMNQQPYFIPKYIFFNIEVISYLNGSSRFTCCPTPFPTVSCTAVKCLLYAVRAKPPDPPLGFGQNASQNLVPPATSCRSKSCQWWTQGARHASRIDHVWFVYFDLACFQNVWCYYSNLLNCVKDLSSLIPHLFLTFLLEISIKTFRYKTT